MSSATLRTTILDLARPGRVLLGIPDDKMNPLSRPTTEQKRDSNALQGRVESRTEVNYSDIHFCPLSFWLLPAASVLHVSSVRELWHPVSGNKGATAARRFH